MIMELMLKCKLLVTIATDTILAMATIMLLANLFSLDYVADVKCMYVIGNHSNRHNLCYDNLNVTGQSLHS